MGKTKRQELLIVAGIFLLQIVFFYWLSWDKQLKLNPDAVAYIRIAQYYASGQFDLMISGYWGPLFSWIMAPLLAFGEDPFSAARIAIEISALVYLTGGLAVFRAMGIGFSSTLVALGILVLFSLHWSLRVLTPDLLVSGLLCLAISRIMIPDWCDKASVQLSTGLLFGTAYLAKPVGLPLACILIVAAGFLWTVLQKISPARAFRSVAVTFLGLILIASPWILLLSFKYERPVFSTSAGINYSIIGPSSQVNRGHSTFRTFHIPEQGRVTSWEDPRPTAYASWSPLESSENMTHQLKIFLKNTQSILGILKGFDWLGIGLISVIFAFLLHMPWKKNMLVHRWRWSAIFIGCLVCIYLPVPGSNVRYYLATYPFLLGGSLGFVGYLAKNPYNQTKVLQTKILQIIALFLVALCFLVPLATVPSIPPNQDFHAAKTLTNTLKTLDIFGPIASTSEAGHIALYTAFLMEAPFYGKSSRTQTVEEVQSSSAKIIIVDRGSLVDLNLKKDKTFILLDETLFSSLGKDNNMNVNVYINTHI